MEGALAPSIPPHLREVPHAAATPPHLRGVPHVAATPPHLRGAIRGVAYNRPMIVGASVRRADGVEKVTGRARYVDDLAVPGMLHGRTVRASIARGRLERIEFDPDVPWDEIAVVTARDVPGTNRVKLIDLEQPFLVEGEIRHREEPVVLLAHADRDLLARAARGVRLVVTPGEPVLALEDSTTEYLGYTLEKGSVEVGLAEADLVVEGVYETGAQEHVYIEPQGMLAE